MSEPRKWRASAVVTISFVLLGIGLGGTERKLLGQEAAKNQETTAAEQLVAKLKAACMSSPPLRGALIRQADVPRDGTLTLSGTIDREEQAGLIEAEAKRLLDGSPAWKAQIPHGVVAAKMVVFPLVSDLLPRLRSDFASAGPDRSGDPSLLQQTRIDSLYFDAQERIRVVGLSVNQHAYLAHKAATTKPNEAPGPKIALEISARFKSYPIPDNVDRKVIGRILADKIAFEQNPVRMLQRFAAESKLDDILFREARFDAAGELKIDGLLGKDEQRAVAAELVSRPEFVKVYARPDGTPPAKPNDVVAPMSVAPWRATLLASVQRGLAGDAKSKGAKSALRHCRVDRAFFVYAEGAGLKLWYEGVVFQSASTADPSVSLGLSTQSHAPAIFPISVKFEVPNRLNVVRSPLRELQLKIAATQALDGVCLDDIVFGPKGESTLVGKWIGPAQAATLEEVLAPVLAEQTKGKVRGPLAFRLTELPTDRLLKGLRTKTMETSSETGLDRFFFRPGSVAGSSPQSVLQGATMADSLATTKDQLDAWLKADALSKVLGTTVIELTPRPKSLLTELRKLVAGDKSLDGVLVKSVTFDEENTLVLSGRHDHEGQAQGAIPLVEKAATRAWKDLLLPKESRAGTFAVFPLGSLLNKVSRQLPNYAEADGIILSRAYYNDEAQLVIEGRASGNRREFTKLKRLIESLIGDDADIKLATPRIANSPRNAEQSAKIVGRAVDSLAGQNLAGFRVDELDEAIFLDPSDSTAWYVRGAYYYLNNDRNLANRDLARARALEKASPSEGRDRSHMLERFQGSLRTTLEELMDAAVVP
jgi:hypothetical protein